jgi:hypothetical protein
MGPRQCARFSRPYPCGTSHMRLLRPVILVPTLFALGALTAAHPAAAQAPSVFVITASDGYGIGDCLAQGGSCGQMIADAWCAAHGAARAISFGPASAAEPAEGSEDAVSPGSTIISCGP